MALTILAGISKWPTVPGHMTIWGYPPHIWTNSCLKTLTPCLIFKLMNQLPERLCRKFNQCNTQIASCSCSVVARETSFHLWSRVKHQVSIFSSTARERMMSLNAGYKNNGPSLDKSKSMFWWLCLDWYWEQLVSQTKVVKTVIHLAELSVFKHSVEPHHANLSNLELPAISHRIGSPLDLPLLFQQFFQPFSMSLVSQAPRYFELFLTPLDSNLTSITVSL